MNAGQFEGEEKYDILNHIIIARQKSVKTVELNECKH